MRALTAAMSPRTLALAVLAASVLSSSLRIALEGPRRALGGEQVRVAISLAETGDFADPFAVMRTGATAHVPPLFPFVMAAALRLGGDAAVFEAALGILAIAALALHCALLPWLSRLLFDDAAPGLYAAAAAVVLPMWDLVIDWDAMHVACALVAFCAASLAAFTGRERPARAAVALGAGLGLMLLLNPSVVTVLPPWLAYVLYRRRARGLARGTRLVVLMIGTAAAVCVPWTMRNHARLGGGVFVRDNFGLELYTSNNDCASPSLEENLTTGCHRRTHPNKGIAEALRLSSRGEIAYNRERLRDAVAWISTHPRRFAELTAHRFALFWFPSPLHMRRVAWSVWLVTAASIPGLVLLWRRRRAELLALAGVGLCYSALYYVVQADIRYRFPILWASLLPAGWLGARIAPRILSATLLGAGAPAGGVRTLLRRAG